MEKSLLAQLLCSLILNEKYLRRTENFGEHMLGILEEHKNVQIKRKVFGKNIKLLAANVKYLRGMYNFWMQMRCISEEQKTSQV